MWAVHPSVGSMRLLAPDFRRHANLHSVVRLTNTAQQRGGGAEQLVCGQWVGARGTELGGHGRQALNALGVIPLWTATRPMGLCPVGGGSLWVCSGPEAD